MESELMLTPGEKSNLPGAQRRVEPATLHYSAQKPNKLPLRSFSPSYATNITGVCQVIVSSYAKTYFFLQLFCSA